MKYFKKSVVFVLVFSFINSFTFNVNAQIESIDLLPVGVSHNGISFGGFMSSDGRYVSLISTSSNLVAGDTNDDIDVFLYDAVLDTTERVSVATGGIEADGNADTFITRVSDDGRYVAFISSSTSLVAGDTNGVEDIFVHDRTLDTTERVSVATDGTQANATSTSMSMSADGRYVVFGSEATNLVAGDTNGAVDIFLHDRTLDTTERVSVATGGGESNDSSSGNSIDISDDGRYIAFASAATNLVAGDTNNNHDVFVYDRTLDTTERVSVTTGGIETEGSGDEIELSSDGRYVVFSSAATDLITGDTNGATDVFLHDRTLETTERVSVATGGGEGNSNSYFPYVSDTGRMVVFTSEATNLVAGDTNSLIDTFLHDRLTGITERISIQEDGSEASGGDVGAGAGIMSDNGQFVAISADFNNLVSGDLNAGYDLFLLELTDDDGISATIEKAAPNDGDADDSSYIDSVEHNVTSVNNALSGDYTTVVAGEPGECLDNESTAILAESSLASPDTSYDYPLGIVDFSVNCNTSGDDLNVTLYFYGNFSADDYVLRKFNSSNNSYSEISGATLSDVTIDGESAIKVEYSVVDGGDNDEDGLVNGVVVDPVGLGSLVAVSSSGGGSSSGSRPRKIKEVVMIESEFTSVNETTCDALVSGLLKRGVRNEQVLILQNILNKKGLSVGPLDGIFGPMTDSAVRVFQTNNKLIVDGIVGPQTRSYLNKNCI